MLAPNLCRWPHYAVFLGFPVVNLATQITNDVPFSLAYGRDTRHYPSRHSDLKQRGGNPCCPSQGQRTLVRGETNIEQVDAGILADGNKVGEFY
jgi:hypothetical protein